MKLLLVEDDRVIASGLEYSLCAEGYEVTVCHSKADALRKIEKGSFDIYILDVLLPDGSGYDICRSIRKKQDVPVLFLTACDEEVNVVMGLDIGADDYVTKPFRIQELFSRMRSVLRRYRKGGNDKGIYQIENLCIDTKQAKVYKDNKEVLLTALEYRLLLTFLNNLGQVLTRRQLLEGIWDVAGDFVSDNTLTVYIKRLRDKLEQDSQNPVIIKTVRGLGYRMGDDCAQE